MLDVCTCSICGGPIGVYERVWVLEADSARATSLAREPGAGEDGATVIHDDCSPRASGDPNHLPVAAGLAPDQ